MDSDSRSYIYMNLIGYLLKQQRHIWILKF